MASGAGNMRKLCSYRRAAIWSRDEWRHQVVAIEQCAVCSNWLHFFAWRRWPQRNPRDVWLIYDALTGSTQTLSFVHRDRLPPTPPVLCKASDTRAGCPAGRQGSQPSLTKKVFNNYFTFLIYVTQCQGHSSHLKVQFPIFVPVCSLAFFFIAVCCSPRSSYSRDKCVIDIILSTFLHVLNFSRKQL